MRIFRIFESRNSQRLSTLTFENGRRIFQKMRIFRIFESKNSQRL